MSRTVYYDSDGWEIEPPNADPIPVTNGDRIRAMSDEELAEWICEVQDGDAYQKENYLPPLSKSWWLKWLKREADHA